MNKAIFKLLILSALITLSACSLMPQPAPTPIVLFRASIDDIRDGPPYSSKSGPSPTDPTMRVIDMNSYFYIDYDLQETLIGQVKLQRGAVLTTAWHMPISNREPPLQFYILARQDSEGKMRNIYWSQVKNGFCLEHSFATKLGIQNEMQTVYLSDALNCRQLHTLGYQLNLGK
ncbi:MAG: hypothetical protein WA071_26705 [Undibacterium umbellatum]|uniref:hypothetical protein n=1 Tax=Undibacterium umbellatum TaxID=2762300 RepID=UPI003BB7FDE1